MADALLNPRWYTGASGWRVGVHFLDLYRSQMKFGRRNVHARRILALKRGDPGYVLTFAEVLALILCAYRPFSGAVGIVPVPSKDRPRRGDPRYRLVAEIARRCPWLASGAGLLYRRLYLPKWKRVGRRTFRVVYPAEVHRESLGVRRSHPAYRRMAGRKVILFDDVATSGGSLKGAARRLMEHGMTPVMFVLGMDAWRADPELRVWIDGRPGPLVRRAVRRER